MTDQPSDEALMAAYAAGDWRAFEQLFTRLAARIHRFFRRSFRDESVADDLMQQTFLKLHRYRERYDSSRPLAPWLFTIAAGVRRDELRRRYRLPMQANEEEIERAEGSAAGQEAAVVAGDRARAVQEALARLPETQRVVIHLHRFEGLTFAEVAEVLETSPGAVRVRATRAYASLRELLEEQLGG